MTYIELINEFWRQDRFDPTPALDAKFYFFLLDECNKRKWINPFELQPRIIEIALMISRKTIGEVRNRLKQRGLIDFVASQKKPTIYRICNVEDSANNPLSKCFDKSFGKSFDKCFLQETNKKLIWEHFGNISGNISVTHIEDIKTKDFDLNNNILLTRTREEQELERFDNLIQGIYDGEYPVWANCVCKKLGIESVTEYLPSFRNHVVVNARLDEVTDIRKAQQYFVNAFRYFSKESESEQFANIKANASEDDFKSYCDWVQNKVPNVISNVYPLTEDEFHKLKDTYTSQRIMQAILEISNRKDLLKKYFSLYRTLINWIEHEK